MIRRNPSQVWYAALHSQSPPMLPSPKAFLRWARRMPRALAITSDGTSDGRLHAIVTSRDLEPAFGDQPVAILREIPRAANMQALRDLNRRARAFTLQHLTSAAAFDWLARFTTLTDVRILGRILELLDAAELPACWCFCGSSGRGESLTRLLPQVLMILDDDHESRTFTRCVSASPGFARGMRLSPRRRFTFRASHFMLQALLNGGQRYSDWVRDPVLKEMYAGPSAV